MLSNKKLVSLEKPSPQEKISWPEFDKLTPKQKAPYLLSSTGKLQSLVFTQQLNREIVNKLFGIAELIEAMSNENDFNRYLRNILSIKSCTLYFTQCSTRTFTSFSIAAQTLGMMVEEIRNADMSSTYKGESELDTLLSLAELTDIIILRSKNKEFVYQFAYEIVNRNLPTRIVNGGSGSDQHPTQALLEIYTIFSHLGINKFHDKTFTVAIIGDLRRSRTARSLSYLLALYPQIKQIFIAPEELQMKKDIVEYLDEHSIRYDFLSSIDDCLDEADVFYMMRIQDEYSATSDALRKEYEKFSLTPAQVNRMKKDACIIHPLPRRQELPIEIDQNPRAKYWEAVYRGKLIRIALFLHMFGLDDLEKLKNKEY